MQTDVYLTVAEDIIGAERPSLLVRRAIARLAGASAPSGLSSIQPRPVRNDALFTCRTRHARGSTPLGRTIYNKFFNSVRSVIVFEQSVFRHYNTEQQET